MLGYSILLVFGFVCSINCNKVAANSPQGMAVNIATMGNDAVAGVAEPYFSGVPEDVQAACAKFEKPEEQFARITENRNDAIDFAQFLQLDSCGTAWRKHDFMKIDTNKDNKITIEEWNAHNEKLRKELEEAILNQRNFTFTRIDADNDGVLSKKELKKYLEERWISSSNLTDYLDGKQLNFEQFVDFDSTIPNATFSIKVFSPIYDYSVPDYMDEELVDPVATDNKPQTRPLIRPAIDFMPMPAISPPKKVEGQTMNIQIDPPVAGNGPKILPFPAPQPEGAMSAAVMPH
jgi:hypothetical protein